MKIRSCVLRQKLTPFILLIASLSAGVSAKAANIVYATGFESNEGYQASNTGVSLTGQTDQLTGAVWERTSGGNHATLVDYLTFAGSGAVRAYGTADSTLKFNSSSTILNHEVMLDSYMMIDGTPGDNGYAEIALLDELGERQAAVQFQESSGKLTLRTGATTIVSDDFSFSYNQYYHIAISVNYSSGQVSVYAKAVERGDKSPLSAGDIVSFNGGETSIGVSSIVGAYAGTIRLLATSGAIGYYDEISVRSIPEPGSGSLLLGMIPIATFLLYRRLGTSR